MARIGYLKIQANNRGRMCACIAHNLRTHDNHSNRDIDVSKSGDNVVLYDLNYQQTVQRLYDRLDEVANTNTNTRKDRVEMVELTIPYPRDWQQLTHEQQVQWGMGVIHYIQHQYGKDNVIQAVIHYDEIHDYIDPNTKQLTTSRPHIHIDVVPERDGKLDSKNLHSKKHLQNRNEAIDKWTKKEFGIVWKTGEYKKDTPKKSIEELKTASAKLADVQRAEERIVAAERVATDAEKTAMEKEVEAQKRIALANHEAQQAERNAAVQRQRIHEQGQRLLDDYKKKIKSLKKQERELQTDLRVKEAWINDYNQMLENPESDDYKIYIEYRKQVESGRIDERMEKAFEAAFKGDGLVSIDDWVK